MAVGAKREKYLQGLRFHVSFPTYLPGKEVGFQKVSGLSMSLDVAEYREGDDPLTVKKFPGLVTYDNVTFEKGIVQDDLTLTDFFQRLQSFQSLGKDQLKIDESVVGGIGGQGILNPAANVALSSADYRTDVLIKVLDRESGIVQREYTLKHAFVVGISIGDIDAQSGDLIIESMEMAHEGLLVK